MSRYWMIFVMVCCLAYPAPAEIAAALNQAVSKVSAWLTQTTETSSEPAFASSATVITFDRGTQAPASLMQKKLANARLLAVEVYPGKPLTLASDLSRQLQGAEEIDAQKVRALVIDDSRANRLNEIACAWATDLLDVKTTDSVAALVYWHADEASHSLMRGVEPEPKLILVLVKLQPTATGYAVGRIAWGAINNSSRQ